MNPNWRPGGQPQQQQQQQQFQQQQQYPQQGGLGYGGGLQPQPTGFPQQQRGFLGPQPTGFQPQQTGFQPQQTGFQQHSGFQQQGFQQPQQTGFQQPQQTGFPSLQPQATGFPGQRPGFGQQQSVPPVPPLPGGLGVPGQPQQQRFLSPSPGLVPQATGWQGGGGGGLTAAPLVPQATGYHDPRVQMMTSTFMPAAGFQQGGALQFAGGPQGGQSLQQSMQQHNQELRGTAAPRIPWKLTRDEQKNYDQIFRAWDHGSTGFISGQMALEVFGQSGLPREELAKIWTLADADNRGKLNLAEFHVAMGLIFRRLNGNDVPDVLPPELVPASARDLGDQVGFLKDLLKNDTNVRATSSSPASRAPQRSFHENTTAADRKDGTVYRHDDTEIKAYKSASRHIDRSRVRFGDDSPSGDLDEMKRQLADASKILDRVDSRSAADDELDREMDDLKRQIRRVQDDLEYVSRGPRTSAKDQERRKLERELLELQHERIPAVERRLEERDRRRKDDDRDWARDRDRRNAGYRERDRDDDYDRDRYDRDRERERERERDVGYLRGSYDRDRPRSRGYDDSERPRSRGYDDRDRPRSRNRRSPSRSPSPPPRKARTPAPPPTGPSADAAAPPAPPPAPATPTPAKGETKEERAARLRAQTQAKIQERMRVLGVAGYSGGDAGASGPNPVEERLEAERKEAEEKAKKAEREAEEREEKRRARLEEARGGSTRAAVPTPPAPAPPAQKAAPPAPTPRGAPKPPAPPVNARGPPKPPAPAPAPVSPAPPPLAPSFDDEEDEELKRREKVLRERRERLEALRREEEEAQRAEAEYEARKAAGRSPAPPAAPPAAQDSKRAPPPPVRSRGSAFKSPEPVPEPTVPDEAFEAPAPPPPAPPAPPAPAPPAAAGRTNPFFNRGAGAPAATTAAVSPPANPWGAPTLAEPEVASPPPPPPPAPPAPAPAPARTPTIVAPVASKEPYNKPPAHDDTDDWDVIQDKEEDDSSDDEYVSRNSRQKMAEQLFSGILPGRPQSAGPPGGNASRGATPVGGPKSAAPALGGDAPPPPPPPPAAPAAPKFTLPPPSADPSDRGALLGAIQMGAKLRKAVTNDRSGVGSAGAVVGDAAPPEHINIKPVEREPEPEPEREPEVAQNVMSPTAYEERPSLRSDYRQSVDWYSGLAAEGISPASAGAGTMPSMREEEDEQSVPAIQVESAGDELADVDLGISKLVRSLYPYEGQRAEDLSFGENLMINAHPSKSGGDWWYGSLSKTGKKGFFPRSYVDVIEKVAKAKALYAYEGSNADELPLVEGDVLSIVDHSEADWWKAEKDGMVFIVPAGYLELIDDGEHLVAPMPRSGLSAIDTSDGRRLSSSSIGTEPESSSDELSDGDDEDAAARAQERQRVLEAAGLIVKKAPPRPPRKRHRRPAPKAPVRDKDQRRGESRERPSLDERRASMSMKDLPEPPLSPAESVLRIDDAYERYQAFRESRAGRASLSSIEGSGLGVVIPQGTGPPPSPSGTVTSLPSSVDQTKLAIKSFFGRSSTEQRPAGRVISAPVISAPVNAVPERGSSPGFGMSWSSLVDRSVVEGIPDDERKRQEAIFELIATESAYVHDLQMIVEKFYASMVPLLDEKSATVIFANVEDILLCNTTFLSSLEERQKDCRLYIDQIGDILDAHMAGMAVYMPYCVHQASAIKVLQGLRESNPELAGHLQASLPIYRLLLRKINVGGCIQRLREEDPDIRNLDLSSYLLIPMQRITRYPLLMKQILNYTHPESERAHISHAIATTERLLDAVNEAIREREGAERLGEISKGLYVGQGHLDLTAPTRYMGPRRLLKEGVLVKSKSGRRLHAVLCNDIFVLMDAAAQSLYRMPMSLTEVLVKEGKDDYTLIVQVAYPRGGDTIALRAGSAREARAWIDCAEKAQAEARRWLAGASGSMSRRSMS